MLGARTGGVSARAAAASGAARRPVGARRVRARAMAPLAPQLRALIERDSAPQWHAEGTPEERVKALGIELEGRVPTNPQGIYHPVVLVGNQANVSGQIPRLPDGSLLTGIAGSTASEEEAAEAAYNVGCTMLASIRNQLGSLDRVKRVVMVRAYVASTPEFERQPAVVNALSNLFIDVFGPAGKSARSAVGVAALPLGITVEAEAVIEVDLSDD